MAKQFVRRNGGLLWIPDGEGVMKLAVAEDPCDCCGGTPYTCDCIADITSLGVTLSNLYSTTCSIAGCGSGHVLDWTLAEGAYELPLHTIISETVRIFKLVLGAAEDCDDRGLYLFDHPRQFDCVTQKTYLRELSLTISCEDDLVSVEGTIFFQTFNVDGETCSFAVNSDDRVIDIGTFIANDPVDVDVACAGTPFGLDGQSFLDDCDGSITTPLITVEVLFD